ncbi:MAG: glutathione S-transferase family protein [Nevskiales bacterium]
MQADIVLHQWEISPFCQKVARALRYKGLDYSTVDYNGLLGTRVARLSGVGKVPVLDVNGERIQDSTRIARYLDEHFPDAPLYPADAQQRVQVELWEDWADELLYWYEVHYRANDPEALDLAARHACEGRPAIERLAIKPSLKFALNLQLKSQGLGRMKTEDINAEFLHLLDRVDTALAPTGWLVGENMTMADISVGSQLLEIDRTSKPMRGELWSRPHLAKMLKKLKSL